MTAPFARDGIVVAPCACGDELYVSRLTDDDVRAAVQYHQGASAAHRRWRLERYQAGEPAELIGAALIARGGLPIRVGPIAEAVLRPDLP